LESCDERLEVVGEPSRPAGTAISSILQPTSIAIVGASERNTYATIAVQNLAALGYAGKIHMVNPRGGVVFGRSAFSACAEIGEPVDVAYMCVPVAGVLDAMREAATAGIRSFVVLSSGFAEIGADGAALQDQLVALCRERGLRMLGPNCLGFVNYAEGVALGSIPVRLPQADPLIAIVSGSGATAYQLCNYANQQGVGVTHIIATGNEADITTADCLDYLIGHPAVRAIAVFLESIRDPAGFIAAAEKAALARKPIVALKVGVSPTTAAVAAAHTGALVGDDRTFDAACDRLAIVRVSTFEQLVTTAAALGGFGVLEKDGVACVSVSGGACEVMSDLAHTGRIPMPAFTPETASALQALVSDLGQTHNPLDLTGAAIRDPSLWEKALRCVSSDPQIGLTLCNYDVTNEVDARQALTLDHIAAGLRGAQSKAGLISTYVCPITEPGRAFARENRLPPALSSLGEGLYAVGKLVWWSRRVLAFKPLARPTRPTSPAAADRPICEQTTMAYLRERGVPVVPSVVATHADEAVAAARRFGGAVALKIASPDIAHKTDIGGVRLGLNGDAAVATAFAQVMDAAREARPQARLQGVAVSPMRERGVELFVGVARDPIWGPVMALGLGGVWVEAMDDTCLRLLPVSVEDVVSAFKSLRAARLLQGFRGAPAVDLQVVAQAVVKIGDAALALGGDLAALEINPLLVCADRAEALDALAVWTN
jgi:acyl-CoA synthetase (NDP forming)